MSPEPVRPLPAEQSLPDNETDALNDTLAALRIHGEKTREGLTALARRLDTLESRINELQKHTVPVPTATAPSLSQQPPRPERLHVLPEVPARSPA